MQTKHKLKLLAGTLAVGIIAANPLPIEAVPLHLDYTVNPSGGGYAYEFKLTLDNHDSTFVAGQGWSWIIFGDNPSGSSVLSDFVVTPGDFPVGPFTTLGSTGGGHNGPNLAPIWNGTSFIYWTPFATGDFLYWTGASSGFLGDGQLLFSTILTTSGAVRAEFEVAHRVSALDHHTGSSIPDNGSTVALLGCVLTGLGMARRRTTW